ncbi:hypothetical protein KVR01_005130 [Diaporthe batatas]|uniref:uncharacterized protein n=1 Tax=Diaporthe batatas TaxID=748121 RepID=UPI001D044C38|nr:uncharacterized protein KVR01_005130 [Diaporthe batatas]KAG8164855.1 hypothetical protein KVR01_005130 [Diaporthe batatas]
MLAHPSMDPRLTNRGDPRYGLFANRGTKVKKVQKTKFLGVAPNTAKECRLALPHNGVAESFIDETDLTTTKILAEIRSKHNVWVKINRGDPFVTLSGDNIQSLNLAKDALRLFLVGINQEVQNRMIILTHRPSTATQDAVHIKPIGQDNPLYRPVALKTIEEDLICFSDSEDGSNALDGLGGQVLEIASGSDIGNIVNQFRVAVHETGKRLRPAAGELRVRAHMGIFTVKKRQKKTDKYESDDALKKFLDMGAERGFIYVHHKLGDQSWAARMLETIYKTEDPNNPAAAQFYVADASEVSIRDMKPNFTLVLFAKDLKIEVDITYDPKYHSHPHVGSVRAFSFKRDKVAEVAVACPNRIQIPAEVLEFIHYGLRFKPPVSKETGINDDFLVTEMNNYLLRAASIDNVACKVFWTFQTAETPYYLEVAVYHEWGGALLETSKPVYPWKALNTAAVPHPIKSCGVSIYGHDWDHKMRGMNKPGKERQADFVNGFPELFDSEEYNTGIEHFLQQIQRLHDFTDLANESGQGLV